MIPLQLAGYDLHPADIVGSDGSMDALERQFSDGLELDYILDLRPDTLADENLSVPGLAAEAGGEIGNTADCSIIEPPFDSDLPQRRVALGDADPETDPSVVEAPMYFKDRAQPRGYDHLRGTDRLCLSRLGSLTVEANTGKRAIKAGDALFVTADSLHSFAAAGTERAVFVHWVLGRADELVEATEREPAGVTELYRNSEPIPELKPGPYEFTLTRVAFPPPMAPNTPHYRSGAALYYILEGSGTFNANGKTEERVAGMPHFEPQGWVHRRGNPGDEPLVLLQANISEEGVPAVILVQ